MQALLHQCPRPAAGHRCPVLLPGTPGHSRESLHPCLVGSLLLSFGSWCTQGFVCVLQEPVSPVLCKFWQICGRVNGDVFQKGLCHTQIYCTESPCPCPCSSPQLTCTSAGDTQTQFWLNLCGFSVSWCTQGLFQSSECHWWVWGLILNMISPLLLSCWGFSFAIEHGVSFFCGIQHYAVVILEFLQEKMSTHPSILPSWRMYICGFG